MWPLPPPPLFERPLTRRSRPMRSRRQLSYSSSSFAVPFSWEQLPGIPKTPDPDVAAARPTDPLLPLPPLLRSAAKKPPVSRTTAASVIDDDDDPFAAALAECAKDPPSPAAEDVIARASSGSVRRRRGGAPRTAAWSFSDRLGLFVLQASCKGTCAIANSAVYDPSRSGSYYDRIEPAVDLKPAGPAHRLANMEFNEHVKCKPSMK